MKANVKVELNAANIEKLQKASLSALAKTMDALKTEVSNMQVVPHAEGTLQDSVAVGVTEERHGFISWSTPYARRLYFHPEYNFRTDRNPNAQGMWMDIFIYGPMKDWLAQTYGAFLKADSGGVIK